MSSSVEQIKSRLNIIDVVQTYIKLQKAGVNFKANCPFHSEKTPSFFVSPTRESWHCFGCNRGGDIFSFVMEIEGVEFIEALKILADRAGVELKPIDQKYKTERSRLLQLMDDARKFYEFELKKHNDVIEYLKGRGLKGETAKAFGIGFAPEGWRNLYDFLKKKNYSDSEMEKSGMAIKSEKGYYDRFRSRIMFPLFNSSGQVIGFSGRVFGKEDETTGGKYINTPQTILFDKSKFLYGLERAKEKIREKDNCILVEGQMDVIMSHQAEIKNTVAVSGTALTNNHLNIIKRLTENLTIAFDKDEAGLNAAKRGIDLALVQGFDMRVAVVPSGKDPADIIKNNPSEWESALISAKPIIEFFLDLFKTRKEIEKKVLPYMLLLPSEMEKGHWVSEIARRLNIKEESVWEELKKAKVPALASKPGFDADEFQEKEPQSRLQLLQDQLLGFILWQRGADDQELKILMDKIIDKRKIDLDSPQILKTKEKMILTAELLYGGAKSLKDELEKIAFELEKEEIKSELTEMTEKIRELENLNNQVELDNYLNKFYKLTKKLSELK